VLRTDGMDNGAIARLPALAMVKEGKTPSTLIRIVPGEARPAHERMVLSTATIAEAMRVRREEVEKKGETRGRKRIVNDEKEIQMSAESARVTAADWIKANQNRNTSNTYSSYARQFEDFCKKRSLVAFPAEPATVVLFQKQLVERGLAINTINKVAMAAIAEPYKLTDVKSPTVTTKAKAGKEVVKRLAKPEQQVEPLTPDLVERICAAAADNFRSVRDAAITLFMFGSFFRESEVMELRSSDVELTEAQYQGKTECVIVLCKRKSKTDKERQGLKVVLSCACSDKRKDAICPIRWHERWTAKRDQKSEFYFHSAKGTRQMANSTPNTVLKRQLRAIGVDEHRFTSRSGRAGGATAACAWGIDVALLKRHGGWKSECVYRYVRPSVEQLMSVSKSLWH